MLWLIVANSIGRIAWEPVCLVRSARFNMLVTLLPRSAVAHTVLSALLLGPQAASTDRVGVARTGR